MAHETEEHNQNLEAWRTVSLDYIFHNVTAVVSEVDDPLAVAYLQKKKKHKKTKTRGGFYGAASKAATWGACVPFQGARIELYLCTWPTFWLIPSLGISRCSSTGVCTFYMGDLDGILGSWFCPGLALVVMDIWGMDQWMEDLFPTLLFNQIDF